MMYNPLLIKGISPDRNFDWKRIHYLKVNTANNDQSDDKNTTRNTTSPEDLLITTKSFAKFDVRVLTNRRMCFAGRLLRGIILPNRRLLQIWSIKSFLAWYSSCIQIGEENFKLDMICFAERENRFLKGFLKLMEHFWKIKPMNYLSFKYH